MASRRYNISQMLDVWLYKVQYQYVGVDATRLKFRVETLEKTILYRVSTVRLRFTFFLGTEYVLRSLRTASSPRGVEPRPQPFVDLLQHHIHFLCCWSISEVYR
jgi:hypothetical protein